MLCCTISRKSKHKSLYFERWRPAVALPIWKAAAAVHVCQSSSVRSVTTTQGAVYQSADKGNAIAWAAIARPISIAVAGAAVVDRPAAVAAAVSVNMTAAVGSATTVSGNVTTPGRAGHRMRAAVRMGGSQSSCRHRQATESGCGSESHERFMKHVSLQKCLQQKYVVRILTTHHSHEGLHGPGTRSRVVETWCAHSWGFVSLRDKIRSSGRRGAGGAGNRSSSGFRREAGSRLSDRSGSVSSILVNSFAAR
jgi:hypothetical protein